MAGAGISTPSGIPDFRTPGSGLYDNLQQYRIPYPEAIFDIDFFRRDPRPFFTLAKELYPGGQYKPNYVHYFCRMLHEKGILLRMYTQNIDGLERLAGIPANKLVEAHGTFLKASCTRCGHPHNGEVIKEVIYQDRIPNCSLRGCPGKVKPDIVFFGEDLPKRFFYYLKDLPQCDLVIIMGTSLEVYPFAQIVDSARGYIPRLLINRDLVGPFKKRPGSSSRGRFNDVGITGDLVECIQKFARVLGWKKALEDLIKEHEVLLETESQKVLQSTSNDQSANGEAQNGSHDSKSTNEMNGNSVSNSSANGRKSAPVGSSASKNGSSNGTRNYHTLVEKTVPLNSNSKTSPVRSSPSRAASTSLPKISGGRSKDNSWAVKVGRYRTQSSSTSSSSSATESSSDDSSSDEN
ncbi:NAD-dependent protein deacetylase sirtuin-3-like [Amphiura filiformis]|uniref:NAD-dependent protein deacetylase sirtuin-3-like n=1 Tax=Amphiura filiformis TaxID=82378 RepID=UPI003B213442